MAKNIYLINEDMLQVMSNHEQIEMQINISKDVKSYGKVIDRLFTAIEKMDNIQLSRNQEEIQDAINRIDFKLSAFNIGIETLFWFWKEGGKYECILEGLKNKGFKFNI